MYSGVLGSYDSYGVIPVSGATISETNIDKAIRGGARPVDQFADSRGGPGATERSRRERADGRP